MQMSDSIIDQFNADGYVVVRGLLSWEDDLQPVAKEYECVLQRVVCQWYADGLVSSIYEDMAFDERLIIAVIESKATYDKPFDISLPQADITEQTPMHCGPAVFNLLRSPRLLDVVEQFVGPEIYSNPVQHTRFKLPEAVLPEQLRSGNSAQVALHQDLGVVTEDADATEMLTVWFPMNTTDKENGCLAVVPGSHRQALTLHCHSRDPLTLNQVCIPESLCPDNPIPLPMHPGDVLFMHRKTQHTGLVNRSNRIRWSFDLRYQPTGQPTGRRWFPGFVARSRAHPETELHDPDKWSTSWQEARKKLIQSKDVAFNRWKRGDPRCA